MCGSAVFCQVVREGETGLHSAGWAGWAEEHRKPSKEEEWCRFHIAMTWTVEWHRSNPMSNQPCPLCFTKHSPHSVAHCIYSFCLLLSATRFLFILNSAFFPCFVCFKPNTHFSSAQVVYVTRLHTHISSVSVLDCLSWALHKRASSLLLLCSPLAMTVSASLFVLVGDSEH